MKVMGTEGMPPEVKRALMEALTEDEPSKKPKPHPIAQAMELRTRWEAEQQKSDIGPGVTVREKRGLGGCRVEHRAEQVLIVWRMLDPESRNDRMMVERLLKAGYGSNYPDFDCLVGELVEGGVTVQFMPHKLSLLERYEPEA